MIFIQWWSYARDERVPSASSSCIGPLTLLFRPRQALHATAICSPSFCVSVKARVLEGTALPRLALVLRELEQVCQILQDMRVATEKPCFVLVSTERKGLFKVLADSGVCLGAG